MIRSKIFNFLASQHSGHANHTINFELDRSKHDKDKRLWYFTKESEKMSPLTECQLNGFDLFLYKLYACQCTVEVDRSNCETEWSTYD